MQRYTSQIHLKQEAASFICPLLLSPSPLLPPIITMNPRSAETKSCQLFYSIIMPLLHKKWLDFGINEDLMSSLFLKAPFYPRSVAEFSLGKSFVPACKYILTCWYVCLFVCLWLCSSPILFFSKGK